MSNTTDFTKLNTTNTLLGVAKQTSRQILLILKQSRMNHTLIVSNISITKAITKLTSMNAYFGSITLIRNNTLKSIKNFKIIGKNQFTQLWAVSKYDYKKFDIFFIQESPWFFICTISSSVTTQRPEDWSMGRTLYWVNTRKLNRELCTR